MVVSVSHAGYIKRTSPRPTTARRSAAARASIGMEAREEDWVTSSSSLVDPRLRLLLQRQGQGLRQEGLRDPARGSHRQGSRDRELRRHGTGREGSRRRRGPQVIEKGKFVVTLTRRGQIKKTELDEYENFREKGIIGVKIEGDDQLLSAALTDGTREFMIATRQGQSIRFPEDQVRPTGPRDDGREGDRRGRQTTRSWTWRSRRSDRSFVLAVCEKGYGKRTQHRGVPHPEPRRQGHHLDRRLRPQRTGRRRHARS